MEFAINKTWNGKSVPVNDEIKIRITSMPDGIKLEVDVPFYDDPKPSAPAGRFDGLWDFEVVEVFLLGSNNNYLEIELGPHGHYLVYYLEGFRNVTKNALSLENYTAQITDNGKRWKGEAKVSLTHLPPNVNKFNAFAIHGVDTERTYLALFPVQDGEFNVPDFHRLEVFREIKLFK